jgi:hypothetical protein
LRLGLLGVYAFVVTLIGLAQLEEVFGSVPGGDGPVTWLRRQVEPFRLVNRYGLFAVMTTSRPEITVEGSLDGVEWRPYVFKYKPGPLDRPPPIVPLHMPRLDWQMWFAALSEGNPPRWIHRFCERLFERSPTVTALLDVDPFETEPPRYVRVLAYDYSFTKSDDGPGNWWQAANKRYYLPILEYEQPDRR